MAVPEPGQAWGIFGGLFDPVHLGHLNLARTVRTSLRLDGVLWVPTFNPPHRDDKQRTTFETRLRLLQLALADDPQTLISEVEQQSGSQPNFTLNTVRAVKSRYPDVKFCFIIGADNLSLLKTWHEWKQLVQEVRLVAGVRPGTDLDDRENIPTDQVELVANEPLDISSTQVRRLVADGGGAAELKKLVPRPVAEQILKAGLYL